MSSFDDIICHSILLFTDHHDWPTSQPYRISKLFATVFNSEAFAKEFLIQHLHLSNDNVEYLTKFAFGALTHKTMKPTYSVIPSRKKRKVEKISKNDKFDKDGNLNFSFIPKKFRHIFLIYCKCELICNVDNIKRSVNELFDEYKKGNTKSLDKIQSYLNALKSVESIRSKFELESFRKNLDFLSIETLERAVGTVKRVYVLNSQVLQQTGKEHH